MNTLTNIGWLLLGGTMIASVFSTIIILASLPDSGWFLFSTIVLAVLSASALIIGESHGSQN
jgi:hypothetical protein